MAKDYSKIKALAQDILKCIGDESEGENPSLPKQKNDYNDGGQESLDDLSGIGEEGDTGGAPTESEKEPADMEKKKKKDSALAMMGSVLAAKVGK